MADTKQQKNKLTLLVYIGIGCLILLFIVGAGFSFFPFFCQESN